jgi:hypothetical protein
MPWVAVERAVADAAERQRGHGAVDSEDGRARTTRGGLLQRRLNDRSSFEKT